MLTEPTASTRKYLAKRDETHALLKKYVKEIKRERRAAKKDTRNGKRR